MARDIRQDVAKVLFQQAFACVLFSLVLIFWHANWFASILLGSFVVLLPNVAFVCVFFYRWRERTKLSLIVSLYIAELLKLIFSGTLAVFSVKLFPESISVMPLLLGMAFAYLVFWVLAFINMPKRNAVRA